MKKIYLFLCLFVVCHTLSFAQKEGANWILSTTGINFSGNTPTLLQNVPYKFSPYSASISDKNGNLLFYTDGKNIYNKNYLPTPNGQNLISNISSNGFDFDIVIVPNPNNTNLYYVFNNNNYYGGLFYHVVDMSLNNGLGDVVQKNISLLGRTNMGITVSMGAECGSFWLLVHGNQDDAYIAYKINQNGLNSTPVITNIGYKFGTAGGLRFSPNGKKILSEEIHPNNNTINSGTFLYDFDIVTGKVSNPIILPDTHFFMNAEFSPDNTKLYTQGGRIQYDITLPTNLIVNSKIILSNSQFLGGDMQIASDGRIYIYNNRVIAGFQKMHVINNPNAKGDACNLQRDAITLPQPPMFDNLGNFPKFPANFANTYKKDFSFSQPCNTLTVNFAATSPNINDMYSWNFGDGTTATIQNPIKTYTQAGTYIVKLKIGACEFNKTVVVQNLATINLKSTLNLCHLETGNFGINSETGFAYQWKPSSGLSNSNIANPTIRLDNQGDTLRKITYKLIVTNSTTNCKDSASIMVSVSPALKPISAGKDTTICSNQSFKLGQTPPLGAGGLTSGLAYQWTPTTGLDSANILKPLLKLENNSNKTQKLTYILRVTRNNCSIFDTVIISLLPKIQAQIIGSSAVCPYSKNMIYKLRIPPTLEGGIKVLKWEIFGGAQTPLSVGEGAGGEVTINWGTINDKAFVKVVLQNELGCKDSVILNVKISPLTPEGGIKFAGADKNICYNESIEIGTKSLENYSYRWYKKNIQIDTLLLFSNQNIANPSIINLTKNTKIVTHTYYVAVRNTATGCEFLDSMLVKVFPKIEFYAAKDSLICSNTSLVLGNLPNPNYQYLWTLNNSTIKISEILNSNSIANPTFSYTNKTSKPLILRLALTTKHLNSECQKTDSIRITVLPAIKKYQIYGSLVICPNAKNITYKISPLATENGNLEEGTKVIKWEVFGGTISPISVGDGAWGEILVNFGNSNDKAFIGAILQNTMGCYDTIKLDIKINQALKPSKPIGKTQICVNQGQNISYETNFTNGSSYEWFVLGGKIMKQTANKVVVNWNNIGSHTLFVRENSVTQTDKCAGNSDTLQVKILASPDTTLQIIGDTSPCEFSQNITYQFGTNLSYNPNSKYVWTIENGEIIGQSLNTIMVNWKSSELKNGSKNTGKITVLETFENGCVGKLQSLEVALTSLEQCLKIPTLLTDKDSTFPFWRIIGLENYPNSEVIVYSLTGAKVYESSNYIQNFNFSTLASGVYVYVLQVRKGAEKVAFRGKMVVVR